MFHKGPTCSSTVGSVYVLKGITLIALMPQCLKQPPHVLGDIETRLLSQQRRKIDYTIASPVNAGCCFCRTARLACLVPARLAVFLKPIFFLFSASLMISPSILIKSNCWLNHQSPDLPLSWALASFTALYLKLRVINRLRWCSDRLEEEAPLFQALECSFIIQTTPWQRY